MPPPSATFLAGLALHPAQARFVTSDARYGFYVGGVGAGKTYAGAVRALCFALDRPGSLGLIGAPTYPMLRDATLRTVFALLDAYLGADAPTRYAWHKSEQRLTLPNGSEILFRSLDEPDRVRGPNLAWGWLDEAPLCGYYAWQVLKGRLRQEGFAPAGWATGTPKGRDGYARDFELAPRPGHRLIRAATMENAAHLPEGYVDDLGYSGAFYEQEVLGLFTAFAGLVYQLDTVSPPPRGHVRAPEPGQRFASVIGGVDWGYTNPTAAVVFGLDGERRAWQVAEWYQRRASLSETVIPALVALTRAHGVTTWWCGPDEPEHIAALNTALSLAGLPCRARGANDAVIPGIQTVTTALALRPDGTRGLYIAPTCLHTLAEYQVYAYPESGRGPEGPAHGSDRGPEGPAHGAGGAVAANMPELPLKAADHALDATRYALHSALPALARTEAYLAELRQRRGERG
jgi:phage terminase large subunit-like protein